MNANTTTNVTLGKGKAVHAGTRTDENGAYNPQPACAGAKAGRYVETTAEVTCKRCLKALADEAAREAAYQDRLAASMSPVTEAHDLGFVHADEPATVADEQPAEVREIREAAEADTDLARRTEAAFRALVADMGPYDDEDDDEYEPDEDELNDPLIRRGALAVAGDLTGFTYRDEDEDEDEDAPIRVILGVSDSGNPLVQGPGDLKGEAVVNSSGQWSVTDADHKFVIVDAPDFLTALKAWSVFMGLDANRVEFVNGANVIVTLKSEQNGSVEFAGRSANVTLIGRMWAVHNEDGAVLAPMRRDLHAAVTDWANGLGDIPWAVGVEVTGPAEG